MPEVDFLVRWPDGAQQHCVSPSRSIEAELAEGVAYPVEEFLRRAERALAIGSERVRAKYGFACTAAAAQAQELQAAARQHAGSPGTGMVVVEAMGQRGRPASSRHAPALGGHHPVVVVGGGQAGLSASWYLTQAGVDHVVLEAGTVLHAWESQRWDQFCLVTPNWQCRLPGHPYDGDDPDGFMVKPEILAWLRRFRESFDAPVHEGVRVERVALTGPDPRPGARFVVETSAGTLTADEVILAVGGYHVPRLPAVASSLPERITQLHSSAFKNAEVLPDGAVLVVGSGQSGAQIAEDLHLSGREVHLAVGTAPRVARFYRGRDVVAWLHDMGRYDMSIDDHPEGNAARKEANHYVTGRGGGRDIDLRRFAGEGMALHGRLLGVGDDGETLQFADDLAGNLDLADATYNRINAGIDRWIADQGIDAPEGGQYAAAWTPHAGEGVALDLSRVSAVVWATGFTPNWGWVDLDPSWLDATGTPDHTRGVTTTEGLSVLGLPWLHTWGSGRFASIDRDARHLTEHVIARVQEGAVRAA